MTTKDGSMNPMSSKPHDAGSHDQPMTPAVQRVIAAADKRARDAAAMPGGCPTPTGCREHGCHGDCLPPNAEVTRDQQHEQQDPKRDGGACCWASR